MGYSAQTSCFSATATLNLIQRSRSSEMAIRPSTPFLSQARRDAQQLENPVIATGWNAEAVYVHRHLIYEDGSVSTHSSVYAFEEKGCGCCLALSLLLMIWLGGQNLFGGSDKPHVRGAHDISLEYASAVPKSRVVGLDSGPPSWVRPWRSIKGSQSLGSIAAGPPDLIGHETDYLNNLYEAAAKIGKVTAIKPEEMDQPFSCLPRAVKITGPANDGPCAYAVPPGMVLPANVSAGSQTSALNFTELRSCGNSWRFCAASVAGTKVESCCKQMVKFEVQVMRDMLRALQKNAFEEKKETGKELHFVACRDDVPPFALLAAPQTAVLAAQRVIKHDGVKVPDACPIHDEAYVIADDFDGGWCFGNAPNGTVKPSPHLPADDFVGYRFSDAEECVGKIKMCAAGAGGSTAEHCCHILDKVINDKMEARLKKAEQEAEEEAKTQAASKESTETDKGLKKEAKHERKMPCSICFTWPERVGTSIV